MEQTFRVLGEIKPKARPRAVVINGYPHIYTPQSTKDYERQIALTAKGAGIKKMPSIFQADIVAHFKMPDSWSKAKKIEMCGAFCDKPKDLDNIAKVVLDALNGIAYDDDRYCVKLRTVKYWAEQESLTITLTNTFRTN